MSYEFISQSNYTGLELGFSAGLRDKSPKAVCTLPPPRNHLRPTTYVAIRQQVQLKQPNKISVHITNVAT